MFINKHKKDAVAGLHALVHLESPQQVAGFLVYHFLPHSLVTGTLMEP